LATFYGGGDFLNTRYNGTVLIISLILQAITIAEMLSIGGMEGTVRNEAYLAQRENKLTEKN